MEKEFNGKDRNVHTCGSARSRFFASNRRHLGKVNGRLRGALFLHLVVQGFTPRWSLTSFVRYPWHSLCGKQASPDWL